MFKVFDNGDMGGGRGSESEREQEIVPRENFVLFELVVALGNVVRLG